jgi:NMD protein affecting ribosome stability and mRNA decay
MARGPGVSRRAGKGVDGLLCKECGLVQVRGTWSFMPAPSDRVAKVLCPACTRVRDRYPAGVVTVPAELVDQREEITNLVRNLEQNEREEHPLERVMDVKTVAGALVVTTTGVHLARHVAHKLAKRFHKKPRIRYADDEDLVHVDWVLPAAESGRGKSRR